MSMRLLPLALLVLAMGACTDVPSGEVGVKTNFVMMRGIQPEIYPAATYFLVPVLQRMDTFSIREQKLDLVARAPGADQFSNSDSARQMQLDSAAPGNPIEGDAVRLKTSDGNDIVVDVTVLFQIVAERAPEILSRFGPEEGASNYFDTLIRPTCRDVIRARLGELTTEEFYDAKLRQQKTDETLTELERRFEPFGFKALDVLVREFRFNADYQSAIEEKKLADQAAEENKSLALAAEQEAITKKNTASGRANAVIEEAKGVLDRTKLEADAMLYAKEREALGLLAVAKSQAEGLRLAAQALEGPGGRTLVAKSIAEALQGKRILMLPTGGTGGLQVTNINDLISQFAATETMKKTTPQPAPAPESGNAAP